MDIRQGMQTTVNRASITVGIAMLTASLSQSMKPIGANNRNLLISPDILCVNVGQHLDVYPLLQIGLT